MIDLLQLRSDELSAENGKLRLQVATGTSSRQLPQQLPNDYIPSHAAVYRQSAAQNQSDSLIRPVSPCDFSRARYTGHPDR